MNRKTEKDIVLYYLNNLLKKPMFGKFEDHICDWFETNSRELDRISCDMAKTTTR